MTTRNGAARSGAYLGGVLVGFGGGGSLGCEGWGAERADGCCPFPLFFLPAKRGAMAIVRARMRGKVDSEEVESMWLKGGSLA